MYKENAQYMAKNKKTLGTVDYAIEGMQDKKAKQIVKLDLSNIPNSVTGHFVICHGTSKPHIEAIADSVIDFVKASTGENPINKEGFANAEWILIDYFDVVIHIFQETARRFYKLEDLWADAVVQEIESDE